MWYGQMSHPSCLFPHQEEFTFGEHPRKWKLIIWNAWFQQWNTGQVLWWFGKQYYGKIKVKFALLEVCCARRLLALMQNPFVWPEIRSFWWMCCPKHSKSSS
jgi:hypothetical protein